VNRVAAILKTWGSMREQKISVPAVGGNAAFTATQSYTYDSLNRLQSATEIVTSQTWKQTFLYDRYGNRRFDAANTTTLGACATAICNPTFSTSSNRISSLPGPGGKVKAGGLILKGFTKHGIHQAIQRGVRSPAILDALRNPLKTTKVVYDALGRPSYRIIGRNATIAVNPKTGRVVSYNPTSSSLVRRLNR
jgi:hypothetical protein